MKGGTDSRHIPEYQQLSIDEREDFDDCFDPSFSITNVGDSSGILWATWRRTMVKRCGGRLMPLDFLSSLTLMQIKRLLG